MIMTNISIIIIIMSMLVIMIMAMIMIMIVININIMIMIMIMIMIGGEGQLWAELLELNHVTVSGHDVQWICKDSPCLPD